MISCQFVGEKLYHMRAKLQAGKAMGDLDADKMPLLQRLLQHRIFTNSEAMSDQNIVSEAMGHLCVSSRYSDDYQLA